jgi:hypothetical protein
MRIAAIVAVGLLVVVDLFQIALMMGAPLGRAAWGGQHDGVLPARLRIASGFAALFVYPFTIFLVLGSARLTETLLHGNEEVVLWALCGVFGVGGLANLVSRSTLERFWAPVSVGIAVCCAIIASSL